MLLALLGYGWGKEMAGRVYRLTRDKKLPEKWACSMVKLTLKLFVGVLLVLATRSALAGNNAGQAFSVWPDTGQTKCYNDSVEIICPAEGLDFHGQDAQYSGPARSYTSLAGGMIQDNVTSLIWEKKENMDSTIDYTNPHDADNTYTWCNTDSNTNGGYSGTCGASNTIEFLSALNTANFGGHNDWRLPTIKELATLVELRHSSPAIEPVFAVNGQSAHYWSSTTNAHNPHNAWFVDFPYDSSNGLNANKSSGYYVRAVRGGQ